MKTQTWDTSGYQDRQDHIRSIVIQPALETVENIYPDRDYVVTLQSSEFSSVCPKTGLPDFAELSIRYIPDQALVEEKSLKLYLTAYRSLGIFQEHATNKILDDFVQAVQPRWVEISAQWNPRGGIGVLVEAEWSRPAENEI